MTTSATRPGHAGREQGGELAGVAAGHLRLAGRAVAAGVGDVRGGDVRPPRLVLDADGVAAEVDGLDQGGADAAHRVGDQVPGLAVAGDRGGGDRGQHLGRVGGGGGQVPAAALGAGVALGGRPHRQRGARIAVRARAWRGRAGERAGGGQSSQGSLPGLVNTSRSLWMRTWTAAGPAASSGPGGVAGAGGDLAAGDGGVQGDDVLGVDQPGGAGPADRLAGVIAQPAGARGAGGDDGQHPAGPQHPLARRVQHARAGSRLTGGGAAAGQAPDGAAPPHPVMARAACPASGVAGLQEQGRAAAPDLGERAQPGVHAAQARQDPLARARSRGQAQDTAAGRGSRGDQHAVAGIGDDDQLTGPGERGDDLRGVRAAGACPRMSARHAPRPGAGAAPGPGRAARC